MTALTLALTLPRGTIPVLFSGGGMEWAAQGIREVLAGRPRLMIVSDERVALFYMDPLAAALRREGYAVEAHVLPVGERAKCLPELGSLLDGLAEQRFARDDVIVALGGGVVTDLAGFAAAVYRRGMPWIAVPTTLMGMVDAAIGGKTGINHPLGKNLIGAFHQPLAVIASVDVLATLDRREWRSGSAEVVKCALLDGGKLWDDVQRFGCDLYDWPEDARKAAIAAAAQVKIGIVQQDERERGPRRRLNLGHTFAHAIEAATGFEVFRHGEAVFLGLRAALRMSVAMRLLSSDAGEKVESLLAAAITPAAFIEPDDLRNALASDKKTKAGALHWVLLEDIGRPLIRDDVPADVIADTAQWLCEQLRTGRDTMHEPRRKRIVLINGPNLNLLGEREPDIYGRMDFHAFEEYVRSEAEARDADVLFLQSNVEGELVSMIQRARRWADGIIINPGGYTHTSVAIHDALAGVQVPAVEVHLSDITKREPFRAQSVTAAACMTVVQGEGVAGYGRALDVLIAHLKKNEVNVKMET